SLCRRPCRGAFGRNICHLPANAVGMNGDGKRQLWVERHLRDGGGVRLHGTLRDGKASKRKASLLVRGWKSPTWPGAFSSIRFSGAYAHRCGKTDGADRQQGVKKPAGIEDRTSAGD